MKVQENTKIMQSHFSRSTKGQRRAEKLSVHCSLNGVLIERQCRYLRIEIDDEREQGHPVNLSPVAVDWNSNQIRRLG